MTDQPEQAPPTEEEPQVGDEASDIASEEAADPARLEALERDIEKARQEIGVTAEDDEPEFIQEGEASEDQPVDDTIAPPG